MHIFSTIDFKLTKLQKKAKKNFTCGAHYLNIKNFIWGKNINQERGGGAKKLISNLICTPGLLRLER